MYTILKITAFIFIFSSYSLLAQDKKLEPIHIKNQGQLNACGTYTSIGIIEANLAQRYKVKLKLSAAYTYLAHLENNLMENLHKLNSYPQGWRLKEVAWLGDIKSKLTYYGLVPESVYKTKPDFTTMAAKRVLKQQVDDIYKDFFNELADKTTSKTQLLKKYAPKITLAINNYGGKRPKVFTYKGRKYTPHSFAKKIATLKVFEKRTILINLAKKTALIQKKKIVFTHYKGPSKKLIPLRYSSQKMSFSDIESFIVTNIKRRTPIYLGFHIPKKRGIGTRIDDKKGLMTFNPQGKAIKGPGHAVVILDYKLNKDGTLESILIQNSFGKNKGLNGTYWMDRYFLKAYFQVLFI